MALKPCRECRKEVSTDAKTCPHCGTPSPAMVRKPISAATGCLIIVLALVVLVAIFSPNEGDPGPLADFTSAPPPPPSAPAGPVLEITSWSWSKSYDHAIAEGQVRNISSGPLRNVMVVITYTDKDGNFITSDDALIDYNPILAGQLSPFKAYTTWNPAMRRASVAFKEMIGGTLEHREKPKRQ